MIEITQEFTDKVFSILADVCDSEEIKANPNMKLFDEGLLDSFGTISLVVEFEQQLNISVPISDFNRDDWATPMMIVQQLAKRK
ncbi:D-alanine--poly(phosphoribitol) ligase subunit DltC [Sporolactobacillus kofuensis]|uniref:D-alanyl carrier protein n=1 Tax=Sporolactobacillus kofuensis TaxID=269672 RepID=A0ABW1WFA9_9BACL|nr:D-alanine--poly(phosphoribitol) ligase subunit DltC [Sporolactobacillus kofuensis]MCO7175438.1 D-alanine--poly(phosphoribitol) ligase subunit DltC [Sporolactobacillus kofuensis]